MSVYVFPARSVLVGNLCTRLARARLRRFQFFAFTLHLHLTVYQLDMGEHYSISSSQNTTTNGYKPLLYSDL